jgi:NAD(P)-dependent dehydrogenase (short-subunit alcohol dehydrogenase family)
MTRPAIFITGAAAGIGRATAERFAREGWFVGLYDVDETGVRQLAEAIGAAQCVAGKLDTTDVAAFELALSDFFKASGSRLDVLFNNAGIAAVDAFEKLPLTRHHRVVDVNLKGVINGCYCALPYLKQTPGARVISMCSASAIYGSPDFAVYSATKFAVRGLTEALNIEWQRHGILVMDVLPLFVATPMVSQFETRPKSLTSLGTNLTPQGIAAKVWRAATCSTFFAPVHWLVGAQTWLTWILQKISPSRLNRLATKFLSGY